MIQNISNFTYTREYCEGELRYILRFVSECYNSILLSGVKLPNHEERITAHLVEGYLKNKSLQIQKDFEGYTFDRETSAGIDDNYRDVGYLDIKINMPYTFEDPQAIFIIECKRLDGNKHLNREYIAEGMMRFITGKYPIKLKVNALLGFYTKIFNSDENTTKINSIMSTEFPNGNTLKSITKFNISPSITTAYDSEHYLDPTDTDSRITLYHLMLDYSSLLK